MVYSKDKIINITKFYRAKLDKERINKQMKKKKGFTLIELLVVIAIIGLLSTLAVISLNGARAKARDAQRVSDVKQLSTLIEMEAANSTGSYADVWDTDCAVTNAPIKTTACGTWGEQNWALFTDPTAQGEGTACNGDAAAVCDYAFTMVPTATDYEICFFLESGAGGLDGGPNRINSSGRITSGACSELP